MPFSVGSGIEVHFPHDWYTNSPKCPHGPMLLFEKYVAGKATGQRYYACSACRNRKDCNAFILEDDFKKKSITEQNVRISPTVEDDNKPRMRAEDLLPLPSSKRTFCYTCQVIISTQSIQCKSHLRHKHKTVEGISDQALRHPSKHLLSPLESNKSNAQYFLAKRSIDFVLKTVHRLHFTTVICIGMPTLHEEIQSNACKSESLPIVDSILLDIDDRFDQFFGPERYCKFNMFNRHFFGDSLQKFEKFLKNCNGVKDKICFVLDPPFGGLVDAIAETLGWLSNFIGTSTGNYHQCDLFPTFWIFPYFLEKRIVESCPTLKMLDYEIDYDNHRKFKRKNGSSISPVRIFTNVQQNLIVLPSNEGYRFCLKCERYTARLNKHCDICGICPSKDGRPYVHCIECGICVKSSRQHCSKCDRCEPPDHACENKQILIGCHLCGQLNHKRKDCHLQQRTMKCVRNPYKLNRNVPYRTMRKERSHPYALSFYYRSSHMKKYYNLLQFGK